MSQIRSQIRQKCQVLVRDFVLESVRSSVAEHMPVQHRYKVIAYMHVGDAFGVFHNVQNRVHIELVNAR